MEIFFFGMLAAIGLFIVILTLINLINVNKKLESINRELKNSILEIESVNSSWRKELSYTHSDILNLKKETQELINSHKRNSDDKFNDISNYFRNIDSKFNNFENKFQN